MLTLTAASLILGPLVLGQEPPTYEVLVLQDPPGAGSSYAGRLNSGGVAVGEFWSTSSLFSDGVVWDAAGVPTALSAVYGLHAASALGIRDDGVVVGSGAPHPFEVPHAVVLLPGGGLLSLPSLAGDVGVYSAAFDVSDAGVVVGTSALVATPYWISVASAAVLWQGGVPTSLGSLGGYLNQARRVNESKTVIGYANTATSDFSRGFVWDPVLGIRELAPAEPGGFGQGSDLDELSRICGSATQGVVWHACLWADPDQPPSFLPSLPGDVASHASAIDESGTMVGAASLNKETSRARLWWNGGVHDLNDLLAAPLAFQLASAVDLGETGQILAVSEFTPGTGFVHVVLTPIPSGLELTGAPVAISVGSGGTQALALDGGGALGGALYLVAGSLSGTEPGLTLAGVTLPLNPDAYFFHTVNAPGSPPLAGSVGFLDAAGTAQAALTLPAGVASSLAGLKVHHACVAVDAVRGAILDSSNAAPLALIP